MKRKYIIKICMAVIILIFFTNTGRISCFAGTASKSRHVQSYMIYYGKLDEEKINNAKKYEIVILHPKLGDITREQVSRIQEGGTRVFGYISIGEDLRTSGMTPEEMLTDERFIADGTGPRVDSRLPDSSETESGSRLGKPSPGGTGYASYYLDDNNFDGKPDININFNCAFTNIGDPAWFDVLEQMTIDGNDKIPGIREILSTDYGRGLGCDGLFLDTIDTCAPNSYTGEQDANKTRYEWTAPGVLDFMAKLKEKYPDKLICQNRGLFFYHPQMMHYKYTPRAYVDYVMFESYMLDSSSSVLYNENFYADNKFNYAPKLAAEAGRPDGFQILSLGYAEGPEIYQLKDTLLGNSTVGMDILLEDINQTHNKMGFVHYITDQMITLINDFVHSHMEEKDDQPPVWGSVHNQSGTWPPYETPPRIGIGQAVPINHGMIVRWDVAFDKNDVAYTLYYQNKPFDFQSDPNLSLAQSVELIPEIGDGYVDGTKLSYPYQAVIKGLDSGQQYYFVIRAKDCSADANEEKNTIVKMGIPLSSDNLEMKEIAIDKFHFPDKIFREAIKEQADTDGDNYLSNEEIEHVTELTVLYPHKEGHPYYGENASDFNESSTGHIFDGSVVDLTGLDRFENLEKLKIHNAEVSGISFKKLTRLKVFEISSASKTKLDFSNASSLEEINITNINLQNINLTKNSKLKKLKIESCGLKNIDVSGCLQLEYINLCGNQLKNIHVLKNTKLNELHLKNNNLKKLDLKQNKKLKLLDISENSFTKIDNNSLKVSSSVLTEINACGLSGCTKLDVSHIKSLQKINADGGGFGQIEIGKKLLEISINNSKIKVLNASILKAPKGAGLMKLSCSSGKLTKLNTSHLLNLIYLDVNDSKIKEADVSGNLKLKTCLMDGSSLKKLTISRKMSAKQKKLFKKIIKKGSGKIVYK